ASARSRKEIRPRRNSSSKGANGPRTWCGPSLTAPSSFGSHNKTDRAIMNSFSNRRVFLSASAATAALAIAPAAGKAEAVRNASLGKAEHCIFVWLGGGAGQIDTWDPKQLGDPKAKKAGSYYPAMDTAIPGAKVCQHLSRCAKVLDRFALLRTIHHEVIDEHAAAANRMH